MTMSPSLRRAALALHLITSVGWIGAAAGYLALGVSAATSEEPLTIRAAWIGMEVIAWNALVPLGGLALLTGLMMSLGTSWGLVRHYWVVFKLVITLVATAVLVAYTGTLDQFADIATDDPFTGRHLGLLRSPSIVVHSAGALLLLVAATLLAIYKPIGMTRRGHRFRQDTRTT